MNRRGRVVRHALAWTLGSAALAGCTGGPGYGGRTSREWTAQLDDSSADARYEAAVALDRILAFNPSDRRATTALIQALGDTVDRVRLAAGAALANPGVLARDAVPELARAAADSAHPFVRASAVALLGTLATTLPRRDAEAAAPEIAAALAVALGDSVADVRRSAVAAVRQLGRPAGRSAGIVQMLARLAGDPDPDLRLRVLEALRAAAPPGDTAAAVARRLLQDSMATVRMMAAYAAADVGDVDATRARTIEALIEALNDESVHVRTAAAVALGAVGASSARADMALRAAREDPDSLVRREAAHALQRFHQRGGQDPRPPEPSRLERCRVAPRGSPDC